MPSRTKTDAGADIMAQIAMVCGLPAGVGEVLRVLRHLPLAAAGDIAGVMGRPVPGVLADLRRLRETGLVGAAQLGCTRRQRQRWHLTGYALGKAGMTDDTWHGEQTLRRLLQVLPSPEQFYQILGTVGDLGQFQEFQWFDSMGTAGPSCEAAARYERGWVGLMLLGNLLSESHFRERLLRLPLDLQELAIDKQQPWPRRWWLVAADQWGRELAMRVAEDYGMDGMVSVRCIADGVVTEPVPTAPSLARTVPRGGWVYQPVRPRGGQGTWEGSLHSSPWTGSGGMESARVLDAVVQWPGAHLRFLKAACREARDQNRVRGALRWLEGSGLVLRNGVAQSARYFASASGLSLLARQDRVHPSDARTRTGLSLWQEATNKKLRRPVSKPHEDGLRNLLAPFITEGCPVANGPRHVEHLGTAGLAPDALLYLRKSPWGEGWFYVEYERSARSLHRVSSKLSGYSSLKRRDRYPVALVCSDAGVEGVFHAQGLELGLDMVTTTLKRLAETGPLDPARCWSRYGQPVELG